MGDHTKSAGLYSDIPKVGMGNSGAIFIYGLMDPGRRIKTESLLTYSHILTNSIQNIFQVKTNCIQRGYMLRNGGKKTIKRVFRNSCLHYRWIFSKRPCSTILRKYSKSPSAHRRCSSLSSQGALPSHQAGNVSQASLYVLPLPHIPMLARPLSCHLVLLAMFNYAVGGKKKKTSHLLLLFSNTFI